jgi:hypothetical protein
MMIIIIVVRAYRFDRNGEDAMNIMTIGNAIIMMA